ncbi:MAG: serine/threonine-protein kinase [Gemmataceae bacterium]
MAEPARSDGSARMDEERLAHALISRGLLTREEVNSCRPGGGESGPQALLARLVAAGFLTANQAERAGKELETLLGQQIPNYQLLEKLGQGAMGTVYKARQMSMNRLVAVKVLHQRLAANPEFLQRLTREAHIAARLSHNNIIQAIDVGSAGPLHYFVMELVEGKTIRETLEKGKVYKEREAIEIILQIAQALQHAHRRGLIHRDVKPANIVLTTEGIAKLADLGMARETDDAILARREKGTAMGTPYYMAPEQIRGREHIDGRADLYALGATLYHMVTGSPPFFYPEIDRVLMAHLEEELTPPDHINQELSSGLGEVVEFLMAKERRRRYRDADDLIIDLECLLSGAAPKLARQQMQAATLSALSAGDTEEEEKALAPSGPPYAWVWIAVLGGLLALSVLINLILLARHSQ